MKYALILGLLAFAAVLIYWRLRPYLKMARHVLGAVRDVRRVSTTGQEPPGRTVGRGRAAGEKLVRCASCGTWLPASRAVTLKAGATYCSSACLERAAAPGGARKSAS